MNIDYTNAYEILQKDIEKLKNKEVYYWICFEYVTDFGKKILDDVYVEHPFIARKRLIEGFDNIVINIINYKEISKAEYELFIK